jgi:RNA polymerase sigma-70 factor (ECF subfamily)
MKPDAYQEVELLKRIRAGDKSACDECILQHAPGVFRLALRLVKNEAEAEDVMQESFLNAFRGIGRFDGRSTLRTWLYRIAYNAAMMRLRRAHPEFVAMDEISESGADGTTVPKELFDWRGVPEHQFETAELRLQMERAIRDLPGSLRAVFVMRELEGLSTDETASALEVTAEVVKTRLHRARLRLREKLSAYLASTTPAIQE